MKQFIYKAIFGRFRVSKLILISVAFVTVFPFAHSAHAAQEGYGQWGTDNAFSSGSIQKVGEGYALTAIGYGSDDWKCIVGIKTAPVNSDGSVDFAAADTSWQNSNCASGTPGSDASDYAKLFEPSNGYVVTGWSWGADTSGGYPDTDSEPEDECFYQEYMNLSTKQVYAWGEASTGTCSDRVYGQSDLKQVARAGDGRVIIGIYFNIDNDGRLDFLAMTTREVSSTAPAPVACPAGQVTVDGNCQGVDGWITVAPGNSGLIGGPTLTCSVPCSPDLHWRMIVGTDAYVERNGVLFNSENNLDIWDQSNLGVGTYKYALFIKDDAGTSWEYRSVTVTVISPPAPAPAPEPIPPPAPVPPTKTTTTCSLTASATTVTTASGNNTVTWTATSNPSGLPYFWNVTGPISKVNVPGEGTGLTNATYTYTYDTSGSYKVYFVVENASGIFLCASTPLSLTVTDPVIPPAPVPPVPPTDQPPTITVLPPNPATIVQGGTYVDAGATASDPEDGNITFKIASTTTVNTAVVGTYKVTYTVSDSKGQSASASRTVNVTPTVGGGGAVPTGKITFCIILTDINNVIATTSSGLPGGAFSLNLSTATSSGLIQSPAWTTTTFSPNRKIIVNSGLDADCITYSNLPFGSYYYSPVSVTGALWQPAKYNDQDTQSVNNVSDFFLYSPELFNATTTDDASRNLNSDGQIVLNSSNTDRTLVIFEKDQSGSSCPAPQITSLLSATGVVGQAFTYTVTASSTTATTFSVGTLPAGLSFSTTTNTISGTPTVSGTYNIQLIAANQCTGGLDLKTLVLTVTPIISGGPSSNISVLKTSNRTTVGTGESIVYTITVANNGPSNATGVIVNDTIPNSLNFVSYTSTLGTYSTTTGIWTIGNLNNASTTILAITVSVKDGFQGQNITNTAVGSATQNDPTPTDNTSSVIVAVNPVPSTGGCTSNCGGGGGGGGGDRKSTR